MMFQQGAQLIFDVKGSGHVMSHSSGCILTTLKCEMQKLLEKVFYMDKTIEFSLRALRSAGGESP